MKFNKVKTTKHYGGGGSTQTTPNLSPENQARMGRVADSAEAKYNSGALGQVAGASNLQEQAFTTGAGNINAATTSGLGALSAQQERLSTMAMAPSADVLAAQKAGIVQSAQEKVAGLTTGFGSAGTLGSGRQAVMQGAQNAATTGALAQVDADYEDKMFRNRLAAEGALGGSVGAGANLATTGAASLAALGGQERTIDQQNLDSDFQALQRYGSTVYGTPERQQQASGGK
jgi:hypothetical protein